MSNIAAQDVAPAPSSPSSSQPSSPTGSTRSPCMSSPQPSKLPCEDASGCTSRCRGGAQSALSFTPFRMVEKQYKLYELTRREARRQVPLPETDMTEVVRLHEVDRNTEAIRDEIHRVVLPSPGPSHQDTADIAGVGGAAAASQEVVCYTYAGVPGLLLFPGVLSEAEQQRWCREAVLEYGDSSQHPNILSTHAKSPHATSCYQPPMRWATLGYSYDWTHKVYHRERYSSFPQGLRQRMCDLVALVAQVKQDKFCCAYPEVYEPQTAIVNYYPVGSMMMCHQDISEETLEQPLMSLSLGCSAIFLMGTQSREDAPHAFLLKSGDMAAFTGPARTAFHSTPRILDDCPPYLTLPDEEITEVERQRFRQYAYYARPTADGSFSRVDRESMSEEERERYWRLCMRHMRVNINARQVYRERCNHLFL